MPSVSDPTKLKLILSQQTVRSHGQYTSKEKVNNQGVQVQYRSIGRVSICTSQDHYQRASRARMSQLLRYVVGTTPRKISILKEIKSVIDLFTEF